MRSHASASSQIPLPREIPAVPCRTVFLACLIFASCAWPQQGASQTTDTQASVVADQDVADKQPEPATEPKQESGWKPMIGHWDECSFGGDGPIEIKKTDKGKALIELGYGDPLTGVRWTGNLIRERYELRLEARRVEGFDFLAAVTFPVGKEHCSFVLGGWGGGVIGISSIDDNDAANNETTQYKDFKNGQWYKVRIRVDDQAIVCWIDDNEWVNVERGDHKFDIRIEMDPCLPMGLANFMCNSEIKNIEVRKLNPPDPKTKNDSAAASSANAEPQSE